jgi:hypothetical protein
VLAGLTATASAQIIWSDNFDSYTLGPISNPSQGGWEEWDLAAATSAVVTTAQARSGSQSVFIANDADTVKITPGVKDTGQFTLQCFVYADSSVMTIASHYILMEKYVHNGAKIWAMQLELDPVRGLWDLDAGQTQVATGPLIMDRWVELRVEIDFDADFAQVYYDCVLMSPGWVWTSGPDGGNLSGQLKLAAIDLWSNGASDPSSGLYYDDFLIERDFSNCGGGGTPVTSYCTAGTTSNGCNATMSGSGTASLSAGNFQLSCTNVEGSKNGIFFYSIAGRNSAPWGNSTSFLCVKAPTQRMNPPASSGGTAGQCDGSYSANWSAFVLANPNKPINMALASGTTVGAQAWYRDPAAGTGPVGSKGTALSDAIEWTVSP